MRGPMKLTVPRVAGFAWLASSVCAAAPAAAAVAAATPPKTVAPKSASAPATADPSDAQRQLATARMWGAKHRDDLARDALRKGLLIAPDDPELLAEQMRVLLRLGDAQGAQAALARLQARAPAAPDTRRAADEYRVATSGRGEMAQIRLLARSGRADEAARRIVALFPNGAPSGALGAEYYQIVSNAPRGREPAIAALRRAVAADPQDASAALALARLLNQRDDTRAEANRIAWSLAKRADTDHTEAMAVWRRVLQSAGNDPAYLDALQAYLARVPDDTEFRDRAAALDRQRDAQRRLERDPDYIAQQRGLQALARGDLAGADPLLARAVQARSDDADAVGGLGLLRLREGRHDEARALFTRAAALSADQRGKWQGLARTAQFWGRLAQGRAAASAGRPQDAERAARAALAMQPGSLDAKLQLADALLAQRDWARAEPVLRELLAARSPNVSAVRDTATLYENTGRADRIGPLLDALQGRVTGRDDRRALDGLRADLLANQARALADKGERGPAAQRYEAAVRAAPDAPWTRFALARLYRDMGLPQLGRTVMDDGLAQSDTPEMRYASALYRNSLDDVAGAQAALAGVDDAHRSDGMRALARKLDAEGALADARTALGRGDRTAFAASLAHAQASAPDDPDMLAAIGAQWIDAGQPERGLAPLRDWIAAHPHDADTDVRLRYGDLLGSAGRDDALAAWLDTLRREPALTAAQTARIEDQSLRLVLRQTDDAIAQQDYARARTLLDRASPAGRADKRHALELADLERAQGHYDAARDALAPVVARTPEDADTQLALARIDQDSGHRAAALARVQAVLARTPDDDVDTRLSAVRRLNALRRPDEAALLTDRLQAAYPARADVTVAAGRVAEAQGRYDDAASLYRLSLSQERTSGVSPGRDGRTPAQAAFADLEQRRDPEIEIGWLPAYKSGDEGISAYRAQQVPIYMQMPVRYDGHAFLQLDTVHLDAGTLDTSDPNAYSLKTFGTYGALNALAALPVQSPLNQQAAALIAHPQGDLHQPMTGVALGAGYRTDAWRVDLGTSPLGFPVHYLVGGVRYRFDAGPASFTVNASRRPETSSVLSYAGMRDPWTGAVWGGVRRDGVNLRAAVDVGRVNLFAELGAGVLSGRNVERNAEVTLRSGFTVPVYERATMRVSTGLVGNAWHYAQNLRYYTYGQGGYYSPQRYLSLGVPIEWAGRRDALSWDLTVTAGISNSHEKDSLFYPTFADQRAAQEAAGLVYAGSSTRGVSFSYGVNGIAEYRVNPHLSVGAQLHVDRSHDYAPSSALVYLRYAFDARAERSWLVTPTPVRLYSDY
ncbi:MULTISPECIES: cellulose synthase subunit BcsC-related outer membrane protein [unclassified Burkholderia]|uniref:cellulose synthase subunit BcsC-related outer membrane protein n=1 Tax=unclassified Burkholderia TaxID=2613784 RepID=UPI000F57A40A|nr:MULTISPECIES: cellulose synthase subunit BcsC-related outer membrane protein [unclassified Burkholderia]RQR35208.1 cellulose biosynthesis protein [Burkholderia sp. Bp9142]RQR46427.1 cellulose biosynthesis protein [Burkholderia sp. Bp9140]